MKKLFWLNLKYLARLILKKYQPKIVSITGSVGKTTTKEACHLVLSSKYKVRSSYKNFNNELGVPLTIIGAKEAPGKSLLKWLEIFFKALSLLVFKKEYPQVLVLEMGIDRPGDMDYLVSIVRPDIAIVTGVSSSHLEFFSNIDKIQHEKAKLIKAIKKQGLAIINYDNEFSRAMKNDSQAEVITYGLAAEADLSAQEITFNFQKFKNEEITIDKLRGINFKINLHGSTVPSKIEQTTSYSAVYGALAAIASALALDLNLVQAISALKNYKMPEGRMNIIKGVKNTYIIDDTYNASPASSLSAIDLLKNIKFSNSRKIVVMGEMLELGVETESGHREVGEKIAELKPYMLICVGEKTRDIIRGALKRGYEKDKTFYFNNTKQAKIFLQEKLKEKDVVLIKGSQGARMERVVKEIMAEPLKSKELLVRQDKQWL